MRGCILLIGLAFFSASAMAPARAAGLGETCDGIAAIACDQGLWCEHPEGQCKVADGSGTCVKEPGPVCAKNYLPVCGCDGTTYTLWIHHQSPLRQSLHSRVSISVPAGAPPASSATK